MLQLGLTYQHRTARKDKAKAIHTLGQACQPEPLQGHAEQLQSFLPFAS